MGYEHLPQEDVPDSDEDLVLEINELSSQQHSRTLFGRHKWNITHAIVLLAQLAVLAVYAQRLVADRNATVEVVFGRDFHYMTLDKEYDHLWDGPEIQEAGVIVLDEHSSTYNDVDQGAISMFHQLHCLRFIRIALRDGYEKRLMAHDWHLAHHWPHCLHYLRESILCAADDFIETEENWDNHTGFIDGASGVRKCRDTTPLYDLYNSKSTTGNIAQGPRA